MPLLVAEAVDDSVESKKIRESPANLLRGQLFDEPIKHSSPLGGCFLNGRIGEGRVRLISGPLGKIPPAQVVAGKVR
jgi:hypothetical protein